MRRSRGPSTQFLAEQAQILAGISPDLVPFTDWLGELLAGGKRLRPAFCMWGYLGAGGADLDARPARRRRAGAPAGLRPGPRRRDGRLRHAPRQARRPPPVRHPAPRIRRGPGTPERFGDGAAILLGDLCLSWADEMLYRSGFDAAALRRAKVVYDRMRTELMAGQYLDLLEQARGRRLASSAPCWWCATSPPSTRSSAPCTSAPPSPAPDRGVHGRPCPATACRSARRSSCATTSWACSATRPRPASRPATTCARASARSSSPPRCSGRPPSRPHTCVRAWGTRTSAPRRSTTCARSSWRPAHSTRSSSSSASEPTRRLPRSTARIWPPMPDPHSSELAIAATSRSL